ncbi:MAG: TonB family protein [Sphingomonadaceae bacterium]|nr:TonB family protein [Sphingomonadaceae bacterium]
MSRTVFYTVGATFGLAVTLAALPATAQGDTRLSPSVNCADTALGSHALICADADLSASEREIAQAYEDATSRVDRDRRRLLQDEHRAFAERRDACDNTACISDEYADRLRALAAASPPATPTPSPPPAPTPAPAPAGERSATGRSVGLTRSDDAADGETDTVNPAAATGGTLGPIQATPPEPIGDPAEWVLQSDYPAEFMRNGEAGTTRYQMRVAANGLPTGCFVIGSSGHFQLDARACRRAESRARFTPARDTEGNAMPGIYSAEHIWIAPTEN